MTFKSTNTRAMESDVWNMVERPVERFGCSKGESEAMMLLEDPIEFAQNMARVLWSGELQDVLIPDMPKYPEETQWELSRALDDAIKQRDWKLVEEISIMLQEATTASINDAREYGIAFGAVLEQLRTGLNGLMRLRNAGKTRSDENSRRDVHKARALLQAAQTASQAAD